MLSQNRKNSTPNTEKYHIEQDSSKALAYAIEELGIAKLLRLANITKTTRRSSGETADQKSKRSAYEIFLFLIQLIFQGANLFGFLKSKKGMDACDDNAYYRFLNDPHYNWLKFLLMLSAKIIERCLRTVSPDRVKCFVLDDSVIPRERSKKVELLSRVFDHVRGKTLKGFNLLLLGWTDGFSFLPVSFNMMASANSDNRITEPNEVDKRTNGYRNRQNAMKKKPDAAIDMLKAALNAGITANYVLMDTWFTNEPFITRISELGLDVIGMLKDTKQRYWYKGKLLNLRELAGKVQIGLPTELFGSVVVKTKNNQVPVKLVFVRNRNKRSEYIIILTTDLSLSESEVIRTYGNRWKIEICFKVSKSMLKLGKEFQGRTYDMTVSTTALVLTRYSILEWVRRKEVDPRTLGEIFFYMNDEIKDIELTEALQYIVELFVDSIKDKSIIISDSFRCKLLNWYISLPKFIQLIFPDFQSEVEQLPVGVTTPIPICQ